MLSRRPQDVSGHLGIHGQPPFGVRSRDDIMIQGGYEGGGVVPGDRGVGGLFRSEVAQGRGGEELTTPHGTGRQGVATRRRGGEAAILTPLLTKLLTKRRNETADPVARYRFDYYMESIVLLPRSLVVLVRFFFFVFPPQKWGAR